MRVFPLSPLTCCKALTLPPPCPVDQALRAGVIRQPYRIVLPPTWKEAKIPNILSGNFCMPNCDEPYVECIFEDPAIKVSRLPPCSPFSVPLQ